MKSKFLVESNVKKAKVKRFVVKKAKVVRFSKKYSKDSSK